MDRLDKFLCDCGAGTRSQVKAILKAGRVTVDGKPEKDNGRKIDPDTQIICMDGMQLNKRGRVVVVLNKPAGYVTATEDAHEKTVMELLPQNWKHLDLKPVGRLDKATEGLLLFTNDGDLLHRLNSPKNAVEKVYYARHEGVATQEDVQAFADGLTLRDGTKCLSAVLTPLGAGESLITVCEGKYHQVRRMMAARQMPVIYLERRQEGKLTLEDLPRGQVRELTEEEIETGDIIEVEEGVEEELEETIDVGGPAGN
jgi:16S rRNA pseudouridine516 synthase